MKTSAKELLEACREAMERGAFKKEAIEDFMAALTPEERDELLYFIGLLTLEQAIKSLADRLRRE